MTTLILNQDEIRGLLPMETCMGLVADALKTLGRGAGQNPLRQGMLFRDGSGLIGMMPGELDEPRAVGLKVVGVFHNNHGTEFDSHQGVVLLQDPDNGLPIGIFDASEITAIRTAAASGVATQALAREEAHELAILGSGVQARTHLEAMCVARDIKKVRVFSKTPARAAAFAELESRRHGIGVVATKTAREAVEGADIVCTATSSNEPVLFGEWLKSGCHINAAGACVKNARELDTYAVQRARLFTDRRESAENEAGGYLIPLAEGAITESHLLGELHEVLSGELVGRESPGDITLFESLGIAVEDLVTAHFLLEEGRRKGVGTEVNLGGRADAPL
jgi:ornithine cyclodeaminase